MTSRSSDDEFYLLGRAEIDALSEDFNPHHQGYVGFVPPREGPENPIVKSARRLAAEMVLLPKDKRSKDLSDGYLKKVSKCREWSRLRCAHCDCQKRDMRLP